jgi:hypothetical protein
VKKLQVLIVGILLLSGCGPAKRGVENNVFYSTSNPSLYLKISEEFQFSHQGQSGEYMNYDGVVGGSMVGYEKYVFKSDQADIAILIRQAKTASWHSGVLKDVESTIDYGEVSIFGYLYEYAIALLRSETEDDYTMLKIMSRVSGMDRNINTLIGYTEKVGYSDDFPYDYNSWQDPYGLSVQQREFLYTFNQRAEKAIGFLKYYRAESQQ